MAWTKEECAVSQAPPEVREQQIKRIMREARKKYSLDSMVDEYVKVYERLNDGPLH